MDIVRMTPQNGAWLDAAESRYLESETVVVRLTHGGFALEFKPSKRSQWREPSLQLCPPPEALLDDSQGAALFAHEAGTLLGQVIVAPYMHRLAQVCDLRVMLQHRKRGHGRALIQAAERWAWQQGFVGLFFETQDDNPGACQFILHCGFRLGGVDLLRYAGLPGRIGGIDALSEAAFSFYKFFT